jgi:hypothetical protein
VHVQPLGRGADVAEAVQVRPQRVSQYGVLLAQLADPGVDQALVGGDHGDDLVQHHRGACLGE